MQEDNDPKVFDTKTVKDVSGTSYRKPHCIPSPVKQVEKEF